MWSAASRARAPHLGPGLFDDVRASFQEPFLRSHETDTVETRGKGRLQPVGCRDPSYFS